MKTVDVRKQEGSVFVSLFLSYKFPPCPPCLRGYLLYYRICIQRSRLVSITRAISALAQSASPF